MAPFPQHLLDGYRTFTTQRLPTDTQKLPATDRTKTLKLPDK